MVNVIANGIQIEYDTFGEKYQPAILLISGLGDQMIFWDEEFCRQLSNRGFYVIRFDNRDVGLSQKFEKGGVPDLPQAVADFLKGKEIESPYRLEDMADDAVGLLDSLDIDKAHICGASMGGGIVQIIGYRHPNRVLTLVSMMSATKVRINTDPDSEAASILQKPAPAEREAYIDYEVNVNRIIGSPGFPFNEDRMRDMCAQAYDRCFCPQGMTRQHVAILAHRGIKNVLASITAPTLVIHGADDPLIPLESGKETAAAIPGAELMVIDGMGHDLPEEVWSRIIDAISRHANKTKA